MNIYEVMFMLQLLGVLFIVGSKVYNVMRLGDVINIVWSFLSFIAYFICWGIAAVVFMANPETLFYLMMFKFETWFMLLVVILFLAELFFLWKIIGLKPVEPYNAQEARRLGTR